MSRRDKTRIAELEAKCHVYECALAAAGMRPLLIQKRVERGEMGFVFEASKNHQSGNG